MLVVLIKFTIRYLLVVLVWWRSFRVSYGGDCSCLEYCMMEIVHDTKFTVWWRLIRCCTCSACNIVQWRLVRYCTCSARNTIIRYDGYRSRYYSCGEFGFRVFAAATVVVDDATITFVVVTAVASTYIASSYHVFVSCLHIQYSPHISTCIAS